jgi:8-oxo-dGTP diphosphatase
MMKYVVGFMFNFNNVVLIKKTKPDWQKGLWNGVGGKVEDGEYLDSAMRREFLEEAGVNTGLDQWQPFATLVDKAGTHKVHFYRSRVVTRPAIRTMTEEFVDWVHLDDINLGKINVVPNLKWLIPFALGTNDHQYVGNFVYNPDRDGKF